MTEIKPSNSITDPTAAVCLAWQRFEDLFFDDEEIHLHSTEFAASPSKTEAYGLFKAMLQEIAEIKFAWLVEAPMECGWSLDRIVDPKAHPSLVALLLDDPDWVPPTDTEPARAFVEKWRIDAVTATDERGRPTRTRPIACITVRVAPLSTVKPLPWSDPNQRAWVEAEFRPWILERVPSERAGERCFDIIGTGGKPVISARRRGIRGWEFFTAEGV